MHTFQQKFTMLDSLSYVLRAHVNISQNFIIEPTPQPLLFKNSNEHI